MAAVQKYQDKDILSDSQLREKQASKGNYKGITWTGDDRKIHNLQTELDHMGASRWAQTQNGKKEISQILKQVIYTERNGAGHVGFAKIIDEISKAAPKEEAPKAAAQIIPVIQKTVLEEKEAVAKAPEFVVPKKVQGDISLGEQHQSLAEAAKKSGDANRAVFEYSLAADFYKGALDPLYKLDDAPQALLTEVSKKQMLCSSEYGALKNKQLALESEQFKLKAEADIYLSQLKKSADSNAQFIILKSFSLTSPSTWLPDFIRRPFRIGVDEQKTKEARAEHVALIMNEYLGGSKHFAFVDGQVAPKQIMTAEQKNLDNLIKVAREAGTNANNAVSTLSYAKEGKKITDALNDAIGKYNRAINSLPKSREGELAAIRLKGEQDKLEKQLPSINPIVVAGAKEIKVQEPEKKAPALEAKGAGPKDGMEIVAIKRNPELKIPTRTTITGGNKMDISPEFKKIAEQYFASLDKGEKSSRMTIKIGNEAGRTTQEYELETAAKLYSFLKKQEASVTVEFKVANQSGQYTITPEKA